MLSVFDRVFGGKCSRNLALRQGVCQPYGVSWPGGGRKGVLPHKTPWGYCSGSLTPSHPSFSTHPSFICFPHSPPSLNKNPQGFYTEIRIIPPPLGCSELERRDFLPPGRAKKKNCQFYSETNVLHKKTSHLDRRVVLKNSMV